MDLFSFVDGFDSASIVAVAVFTHAVFSGEYERFESCFEENTAEHLFFC